MNLFCSTAESSAILLNSEARNTDNPEQILVDSIIELQLVPIDLKTVRQIEIHKLRGSGHLMGRHFFEITDEGIKIYPRAEARWNETIVEAQNQREKKSLGIPALDSILKGGLPSYSVTVLKGDSGTGKTTIGTQFLKASRQTTVLSP